MDGKKSYIIEINGITESVDAVKALNQQLDALDAKINTLQNKTINVTTNTTTTSTAAPTDTGALKEEDALLKQIQATEEKIAQVRSDEYQELLHQKDILKETKKEGESRFAQDNLVLKEYGNTMLGVKERLADLKKAMQTKEIGSDEFNKLAAEANELNTKLKEAEQSYGQFGRNVGNYSNSIEDAFSKITLKVGGVDRIFSSAKEASRELGNELKTMAVNGQQDTEEFKELQKVVAQLNSSMKDATVSSQAMDNMLDTMEGIVALASTAKGIGALFGFDNSAIEQSIQKMVALQNVLQGIEKIRQQMKTGEGIGGLFAKGNAAIDKFAASLLGVSNNAKGASTSLKTTAAAVTTVGTASKAATIAVKALSFALKTIGIGLVITAIAYLTEAITDWLTKESEAEKAAKKLAEVNQAGAKAYANAAGEIQAYKTKLDNFNGSKKQEKALVDELNNKYGKALGNYKSLKEWKDVIINKSDAYCTALLKEAEAQALLNQYTEAFIDLQTVRDNVASGEYHHWWQTAAGDAAADAEEISKAEKNVEQAMDKYKAKMQEISEYNKTHKLFDFSNYADTKDLKNSGNKVAKTIKDIEADLAKARVDAMKQGLTKTLAQLELERNKRIAEVKKTGKLVQEQIELINRQYQDKVFEARVQYHINLINEEKKYSDKIEKMNEEMYQKEVENSRKLNELRKDDRIENAVDSFNNFQINALTIDYNSSDVRKYLDKYGKDVIQAYINTKNTVEYLEGALGKVGDSYEKLPLEAQKIFDKYSLMLKEAKEQLNVIEKENEGIEKVVESIGILSEKTSEAYTIRTQLRTEYYKKLLKASQDAADKELVIEKDKLDTELRLLEENEKKRHQMMVSRYYDNGESEDENKRRNEKYSAPRTAYETYMEEYEKGNLSSKNKSQLGTYFSEYRKLMDEWVENLKKGVQKGKYTWEEYNEFMNQEAIQGYLKAKTEYENFLLEYNAMSESAKAQNKGQLKEYTRNLNNAYVDYLDKVREEQDMHNNQMRVMQIKYQNDVKQAEKDNLKERQSAYTEFYSNLIKETEDVLSSVNNKIDKAERRNAWGIFNYQETEKELKDLQSTVKQALGEIDNEKKELLKKLKQGEISFGDYDTLISQLKVIETQTQDTAQNIREKLKNLGGEWWASIDQWLQQIGSAMGSILSSVSEIQSNHFDKMIDEQEKYIDKLQEMYDKQQDITQSYADAVTSIEDELSTARGDRRQQLIDNLNAEMAAQRASLAQEKKIEKEKEKADRKKAELEYEQAIAKKKMDEAQALINAAMAVSMAAVNKWPIPAIPMMALATAVGAAQYYAVKSRHIPKPSFGDGGIIQGRSHREGGVNASVGGNLIELEGNEFIIRKKSTMPNIGLLDFVNRSEKKLSLEDFIDFYSTGKHKAYFKSAKTMYADGGQVIPTLRDDIELDNRLLTAFEQYSNRPQVVQVVDIVNATENLNKVQVMAGLVE